MSASISTKKEKSSSITKLAPIGSMLKEVGIDYIKEVAPTSSSIAGEVNRAGTEVAKTIAITNKDIQQKVKNFKLQNVYKSIRGWFDNELDQYRAADEMNNFDDYNFDFDDGESSNSNISMAEVEVDTATQNANKISRAITETSSHLMEAQIASVANVNTAIDNQTKIITAGFDKLNGNVEKLMEIMTTNTAATIESTLAAAVAATESESKNIDGTDMLSNGKFNASEYVKMVTQNIENTTPVIMFNTFKNLMKNNMVGVSDVLSMGLKKVMDETKIGSGIQEGIKALDESLNDTLLSAAVTLGNDTGYGIGSQFKKLFGIDTSRKNVSMVKEPLKLQSVAWDSISKEALVNTIPGYLRKILKAVGGEDVIYDYKGRGFKTEKQVQQQFDRIVNRTGNLYSASDNIRKAFGNSTDSFTLMAYDMMINDLGERSGKYGKSMNDTIMSFSDKNKAENYVLNDLFQGQLTEADADKAKKFAESLSKMEKGYGWEELQMQAAKQNVNRNRTVAEYKRNANLYNLDMSAVSDDFKNQQRYIQDQYNILPEKSKIQNESATIVSADLFTSGVDYTNKALYEIFRRLDTGINVFKVGESNIQTEKFEEFGDDKLPPPKNYIPKHLIPNTSIGTTASTIAGSIPPRSEEDNLLKNNVDEETGETENLTRGERFKRWAHKRGGDFKSAVFAGDKNQIRQVVRDTVGDMSDIATDYVKKGAGKVNDAFGNVSGYLKHKMFGTGYSYTSRDENGNPKTVNIGKNEKGGILGFVTDNIKESFSNIKAKGSKWLNDVKGYFDYGPTNSNDPEDKKIATKRKAFMGTTIGAMAGGGILGGPIGMLMGAIGGAALSVGGVDIKSKLFGIDKKTGKPTGFVSKIADKIVSPFQYQMEKTFNFIGGSLKKNLIGPISDIGYTIKRKFVDKVEEKAKGFGAFIKREVKAGIKGIFGLISLPFKGLSFLGKKAKEGIGSLGEKISGATEDSTSIKGKVANKVGQGLQYVGNRSVGGMLSDAIVGVTGKTSELTSQLAGGGIRAVLGTKGFVTRHGLESISNVIAGDTVIRNELKDRRKARDAQVDQEREGYKWGSFKDWKDQKYANRAKKMGELSDYLAEQQVDMSANIAESNAEISEQIKDTNEKMDSVEDNVQTLTDLGSEIGSIYVHDQGIHDRLDTIISIISKHFGVDVENNEEIPDIIDIDETSGFKELPELPESNTSIIPTDDGNPKDDVVGSAITAASTLAISGDTIETDELHDATSIIDEANKTDPSEEKITDDLKDMMSIQQDKKEEEKEDDDENESIFSKILSGVSGIGSSLLSVIGNIPSILTAALGIYALITNIDTVVSNISSWFKKDTDEDAQTKGANAVTAVVDTQADSLWDYAIPGADLYHNDKDATGEYIRNDAATNLKDDLLYETNLKTSLANSAWNNPSMNSLRSEISLDNAVKYAEKAESAKSSIGKKYYEYKSEKALNNAEKYEGMANSNEINTDNLTQKKLQNQADKAQAKADKYQEKADNATSEKQAEKYQKKADSAQAEASNLESEKEKFSNSTIGGVATQATKVGITYLGSSAAGGIASTIASKAGASEETASTIGNVTTSAVTAGVVAAEGLATMKGKTTALDKLATALVDGLASICSTIGTKLASSSLGKKLGADKISDWIKEFSSNLTTGFASKLTDTILKKINSGLEAVSAKLGLGTTLTLSTAGLAVLAGGAVGLLSGACTTPHLFGVAPDDADIWMKLISSALGAAFGAAEMTPAGWIFCIIDIIDEVVKMIPGGFFKYGLKGALAQGLYSLCGGSEKLEEKQERMSEIRENYNSTYGTNLDEATFNDYVNSSGLLDTIWNGTAKITDDNELVTDEGGKVKKSWGLKNIFVGNDTEYEKDENGNLIKDSNGNSIVKTDAYGNVQKKNAKIVDTIKDDANSIKRFFTGGTEYETDENGNVVYDENGNAVVAKEEKGLVGRIKENGLSASSILGDKAMNKAKAKAENMAETISTIKEKASNVLDNISTGLSSIGTSISDTASSIADKATTGLKNVKDSLDKKTSEIADKASELGDKAVSGLKSAGSSVLSFFGFGNKDSEEDTDEDGTKLSDNVSASANTGKAFKSTLSGLNKIKSKLLGDLTDTLDEWENEEYELDEDGNPLLDADGNKIKKGGISTAIKSSAAKITKSTLSKATDALDSVKSGLGSLWNSIKDKVFNTSKDSNDTTDVAIGGPEVSNYDDSDEAGAEAFREYQDKKQRQKYYENKNKSTNYDDSDEALFEYQQEQRAENYANSKVAGGNPLSQNYDITSGYGQRNISGIEGMGSMHYGVDLQPVDSSQITWVKSTYPGTIIDVKSDVPDTDTAEKTDSGWKYSGNNSSGNYVKYQTEDGQIIENMHLKQGSIPGSIFKGMHINAGTDLGQVGSTGFSTAPHLHYAIKDENGTYKDPTSSLNSSNPVDNSVKNEVLNDSTSSAQEYNSQYSSGDYSSSSSDSSSSGISGFISKLLSLGKQFISKLTGGLIGSDDSDSNSSIDSSSSYSSDNGNYTSYDSVELTTTPNTKWVEIVRDVKKAVAAYQPTYYTDAGSEKYVNVTANNKTYKTRVDCSGIIATMLKIYGVLGDSVNVTSSSLLSNNCIPSGFTQVSWPGWDKLVEGDIMARSGHTEIFAYNDGSKHYVYNGGSTKALRAAGATVSGGSPFTVIWRCNEVGSSIGTDGSSLVSSDAVNNNLSGGGTVSSASEQQVWSELDKLGYNDTAKAGIMGVWSSETNNRNDRIEGDYLKSFPGFDTVTTDNTALNDYTQNKLFGAYAKSGLSINKSAYKGSDGNLYPGFGIAQWTGPRAENLFKYTSNKGESWKSLKGQMDFFNNEMSTNVRGVTQSDMNSQKSPSDAAKLFANKFEGTSKSDWISQRQANANRIYNSLAGSTSNGDSTTALGGPIQNNAPIEITEDSGIQISAPDAKKSRKKKIDDNKIIDMNRVLQNRNKSSKQDEGSSSDGTTSKRGVGGPKIDTNAIPDKSELKLDKICIGGPSSNIGNTSTYTKSTTTSANKKTTSSNSNIVNFSNRSTNNTSSSNNTSSDNININTTEIVEVLQKMIVVLQSIDGNTSKSNTLLNNLGTGTNGTTSSSTSSRTVKNSSKAYSSIKNSSNNSRMITSMARP